MKIKHLLISLSLGLVLALTLVRLLGGGGAPTPAAAALPTGMEELMGGAAAQPVTSTQVYLPLVMRDWPPPSWHSQCVDCPSFIHETTPRSIAVDSAGHIHAAYGGDHLYHAWNDGSGWQVEVADASPNVGSWASLVLEGNDYPHISYYDSDNKDLKYAHWDGLAWITETVDTVGGWDTAIALDSSGRPHIAYRHATSGPDLKYAAWDGSVWQITTIEAGISATSKRDTSIALDGGDNPHIGYATSHAGSDPSELKHAWWDGSQWQVEIVETASYIGSNSLVLSTAGYPHFVYSASEGSTYDVKYAHWEGTQWQISTLATPATNVYGFSLVLDGADTPHFSYYSPTDEAVYYACQNGGGWQFETVESVSAVDVTSLALDSTGQPRVSYFIGRHNLLKYAYPGGGTLQQGSHRPGVLTGGQAWQTETIEQGGDAGRYASLALDGSGHPHISYFDEGQGSIKYAAWDGSQWGLQTVFQMDYQIDDDWIYGLGHSNLALDSNSRPHVVYNYDGVVGLKELRYTTWNGSAWQSQVIVSNSSSPTGVRDGASLALDDGNQPHIFYPTSGEHRYAYWDGSQWQTELVDGTAGGSGIETSLVLDAAGQPHAAYFDSVNYDLKYANRDGGVWHVSNVVSAGKVGAYPSLALDAASRPHFSYCLMDGSQCAELCYTYWDGSQWQTESVDATGNVGYYTSLAIDSAGHPHISYHDDTNDALKIAQWDGTQWQVQTLETGNVGWYTSLALDAAGNPHIAHFDQTMNDLRYTWLGR